MTPRRILSCVFSFTLLAVACSIDSLPTSSTDGDGASGSGTGGDGALGTGGTGASGTGGSAGGTGATGGVSDSGADASSGGASGTGGSGGAFDSGADGNDDGPSCSTTGAHVSTSAPSPGAAIEGGSGVTYTIVLDVAPCAPVSIAVGGDGQVTASPDSVVFGPNDWNDARTITVDAVHDFDVEGAHPGNVHHEVTSNDTAYDGLAVADVAVSVEDRAHLALVSTGLGGASSNNHAHSVAASTDGRYVAFTSAATNVVSSDTNGVVDAFVRDMVNGETTRVSRSVGGAPLTLPTRSVSISGDGRYVAFLAGPDSDLDDVYRFDRTSGTVVQVSQRCTGCDHRVQDVTPISADGAFIAWASARGLFDPADSFDVFRTEVGNGTTLPASVNASGEYGRNFWGNNAFTPTISSSGRHVGLASAAHGLDSPEITVQNFHAYVKDLQAGTLTRVSKHSGGDNNCHGTHQQTHTSSPWISTDGNLAVFDSQCGFTLAAGDAPDGNGVADVFIRDIAAKTTRRLSVRTDGAEANGASQLAGISDDARYVLFTSDASNLVAGDTNAATDLFLRDRTAGTTLRIGLDAANEQIASGVARAAISRDGRFVVFTTEANLLPADTNTGVRDVYLLTLR